MCPCAAPRPFFRDNGKVCSDGVKLNVPRRCQQVGFVHGKRGEAALPQMAFPALPEIDHTAVTAMGLSYTAPQCFFAFRHSDQVDMVWHEAICPDSHATFAAPLCHQREILFVVFIVEKGFHATIAALGNVVRYSACDDSCDSWHGERLQKGRYLVNY
jgi:hypothetical protein